MRTKFAHVTRLTRAEQNPSLSVTLPSIPCNSFLSNCIRNGHWPCILPTYNLWSWYCFILDSFINLKRMFRFFYTCSKFLHFHISPNVMYMYDEIALMLWGHEEAISAFVHNERYTEYLIQFWHYHFYFFSKHQTYIEMTSRVRQSTI